MKRWSLAAAAAAAVTLTLTLGCATLEERERAWIFQPSDRAWGSTAELARGMDEVWIAFDSQVTGEPARLHGLWLPAAQPAKAPRIRRLHELGFSVLAIDYRGFGKSTPGLPSEETAYEDARAAWDWLAASYPQRDRYIFGHSLGGAIAIDLAARVTDERGTIVEGTFTSIPDVAGTMKWGWLPIGALISQRFEAVRKVARVGSPLLVVHGDQDSLITSELGRKLYEAAQGRKRFLLVAGGSHHNTMAVGLSRYREALADIFDLH